MRIGKWLKDLGICETVSEANRLVKQGGIAFNKEKIPTDTQFIYIVGEKIYLSPIDLKDVKELEENGKKVLYLDNEEES
jgi:hypothetical protein